MFRIWCLPGRCCLSSSVLCNGRVTLGAVLAFSCVLSDWQLICQGMESRFSKLNTVLGESQRRKMGPNLSMRSLANSGGREWLPARNAVNLGDTDPRELHGDLLRSVANNQSSECDPLISAVLNMLLYVSSDECQA